MSHGMILALGLLALCCMLAAAGIVTALFEHDLADAMRFYLVASAAACCAAIAVFWQAKK